MKTKKRFQIENKNFKVFITKKKIKSKVLEIAERINTDYHGKTVVFVVIVRGALFYAVDLIRKINLDCEIEIISAKSYGNSMESSGDVELYLSNTDFTGKHLILIEDIVDTGITLKALSNKLLQFNPASLEISALLSKPANKKININAKYVGIEIPSDFVIGYGLDFAGKGRHLQDIYVIDHHHSDQFDEI